MPRKKKDPNIPLQGIDWESDEYKGEHPLGISPNAKVEMGTPFRDEEPPEGHYFGYHSTGAGPETILKSGLKARNPLDDLPEMTAKERRENTGAWGVYYHDYPHTEYGEHLYRLTIPHGTRVAGDYDRMGEGENVRRNVPASWITYMGHGAEGRNPWSDGHGRMGDGMTDFHATNLPPEHCPACIIEGVHAEHMAKRRLSSQFTEEA